MPDVGRWSWLLEWRLDPLMLAVLTGAAWLYAIGVRRAARTRRSVPGWRVACTAAGLGVLLLALTSPLEAYAEVSFTAHMAQHLLLTIAAPPLLALGAPIALALRVSSPRGRARLARLLHGRLGTSLSSPLVGWALFVGVPFAIHLTPVFDAALWSAPVHALEHAVWFATATVFWWPIVGADPSPRPVSFPVRLLSLVLAMPATAFLSVAIYAAEAPLAPTYAALPPPWGPDALADQRDAAVAMWLVGTLGSVLAILLVAAAWKRDEDERQRRREVRLPIATPVALPPLPFEQQRDPGAEDERPEERPEA